MYLPCITKSRLGRVTFNWSKGVHNSTLAYDGEYCALYVYISMYICPLKVSKARLMTCKSY